MDLQTRKLNLIELILNLNDKKAFTVIEEVINEIERNSGKGLKTFTKDEMISRAEESNADYIAGKIKNQDQLEDQSKNWHKNQ